MKLAIKTCTLDMPYEQMLDFCAEQGIRALEIGTGNWSSAPHIDLDTMLTSAPARQRWLDAMRKAFKENSKMVLSSQTPLLDLQK